MDTVNKIWPEFDQNEGLIRLSGFQDIMVKFAKDQGLFEGDALQVKQNAMFFTPDNLQNIFE